MVKISKSWVIGTATAVLVAIVIAWLVRPAAIPVDIAIVDRTSMEVTVDEEGRTRVRNEYTVAAPLSGIALRLDHEAGDSVVVGDTVVAVLCPSVPNFHDPRLHQELQTALSAADAATELADADRRRAETSLNLARTELARLQSLAGQGAISQSTLDRAKADVETNQAALVSATAALTVRRNERAGAAARLKNPANAATDTKGGSCMQIRSPASGQILRLLQESESPVAAGAPLLTIGDPKELEIVAELLSTDAVKVQPGNTVLIDGWGGSVLEGRIRRVEPSGFLKVSALGIEEQRVRALIEITSPADQRQSVGHDFRVIVHVVIWRGENVLTAPIGALFRVSDKWAVFKDVDGRARVQVVEIGHRNNQIAEVTSGLSVGDRVLVHASDRVRDGARVMQRN